MNIEDLDEAQRLRTRLRTVQRMLNMGSPLTKITIGSDSIDVGFAEVRGILMEREAVLVASLTSLGVKV